MKMKKCVPVLRFSEFTEDWFDKKISDLPKKNIKYGIVDGPFGSNLKTIHYRSQGIPIITSGYVTDGYFKADKYLYVTKEKFEKEKRSSVKGGDIVMAKIGARCGASAILPRNHLEGILSGNALKISVNEDEYNTFFIWTKLFHLYTTSKLDLLKTVGAQPAISISNLKKFKITIPSLKEQHKIASFFSSVDKKIEFLQRRKDLLLKYKKGVMQQIFSQQIRFKDDDGNDYPDWIEKKISDLFTVTRGQVLSATKTKENIDLDFKYPVYSSQTKNKGLMGYYNDYLFENAITWTTDGANAGDVNLREGKFYCTNVCGVLLSDEGYVNQMIAEKLNTVTRRHVSYVGNPKLMNKVMATIKITIPSDIYEQTKIANFLSVIDNKIELVNSKIETTQEFKKGLLQQMFV